MKELWKSLTLWLGQQENLFFWGSIVSAVIFFGSLVIIPWLVSRIPYDYFLYDEQPPLRKFGSHPAILLVFHLVRTAFGLLFFILGFIMLFLPGQGLLTMLLGLMLIWFPGKYELEKWFIRQPGILKGINWLRKKRGNQPLVIKITKE
ncbi:MAG: hypothetical protein ACE5EE_10760 [Fidelibacterota bacterium]